MLGVAWVGWPWMTGPREGHHLQKLEDSGAFSSIEGDSEPLSEPLLRIGDLARQFKLTLRALRYYQSRGLLGGTRQGKDRIFSGADRERLALILQGKRLGFTLAEIRGLIAGQDGDAGALAISRQKCVEQISLLEHQKRGIETAIVELRTIYTAMFSGEEGAVLPLSPPEPDRQRASRA
jgi:DNA-binding transcriptional MerR regulator